MKVMGTSIHDDAAPEENEPDRRGAPRRHLTEEIKSESRGDDRRVRKPGLAGLIRALLGAGARNKKEH
jgi:hypothetical protein